MTRLVGLISDNNKTHYREKIHHLAQWCWAKEVIVDYKTNRRTAHAPLSKHEKVVEHVDNIRFLGIHISADLTWALNISHLVKKGQQRLFFLTERRETGLPSRLMVNFYRSTIESILTLDMVVWYTSCTGQKGSDPGGENSLRGLWEALFRTWTPCMLASCSIATDPTHPGLRLFSPCPQDRYTGP